MELRSHRSRSRTPAFGGSGSSLSDHESHQNEVNHITSHRVLRSTKTRTIQSEEHISMQSSYSSQHSAAELQQMEINSSHTENQVNHALESGKYSSEEEELLALKMYREAKEYWLRYPKTDYTYSPHSKDRVELAPGVVNMPNMSRKSIHNGADYDERVEYMAHSAHKETNTSFLSDDSTCCRLSQRSGFTTLNNNKDYMIKQNGGRVTSTRLLRMTFIERTWFAVYTLVRLVSAPFSAANRLVLYTVSMLHHLASQLLLVDTWLLRSYADVYHGEQSYVARSKARSSTSSASKVKKVLWLCLIPLLLFGGLHILLDSGYSLPSSLHEN